MLTNLLLSVIIMQAENKKRKCMKLGQIPEKALDVAIMTTKFESNKSLDEQKK